MSFLLPSDGAKSEAAPRTRKPNYNLLHANPLPLTIQPLPPLIPHNPLSLLQILYTYFFCRTPCQPEPLYTGAFNPTTRSVHVTETRSIQAFWNNGFFGKGTLSRSEPTWISRRRRALGVIGKDEALTSEEITERRRRERREFKLERARAEKERIQNQLAQEGKIELPAVAATAAVIDKNESDSATKSVTFAAPAVELEEENKAVVHVEDLEHLQLTLEEAFFLVFGLGALKITAGPENVRPAIIIILAVYKQSNARFGRNLLMPAKPCACSANIRTFRPLRTRPSFSPMTRSCSTMLYITISARWDGS